MKLFLDDNLATATIWSEAEGEPFEGKCAVGEVIRKRMALKYSSDGTVAGTVAKRFQFSALNDDKADNDRLILTLNLDNSDAIVRECFRAWTMSETTNFSKGAVLYYNPRVAPRPLWAIDSKQVAEVGNHVFFSA